MKNTLVLNKMESRKDQFASFIEEGLDNGDVAETLIIDQTKSKDSSGGWDAPIKESSEYGMDDLKLRSEQFYKDEIDFKT